MKYFYKLVERLNQTLTYVLAKTVHKSGRDWDRHLPHMLIAYQVSPQESTRESPCFLLYGRDAQLPTEAALKHLKTQVDLDDYKTKLVGRLSQAWELAHAQVKKAQQKQKYYDLHAKESKFKQGDCVFVYMSSEKKSLPVHFMTPIV